MSMKEFCNTIRLFLLQDVQSFRENTMTMKPGRSSTILQVDDFTVTPKSETSEAGLLYNNASKAFMISAVVSSMEGQNGMAASLPRVR